MNKGPSLVLRGMIIGCLVVGLLGWMLGSHIKILPQAEVAYAASALTIEDQSVAQEEQPARADTCEVSPRYPEKILQWCNIISHFATQAELPPNLIAAVILQESGGDANAYSSSGAVGLMQVMPRDGIAAKFECINGPCFASRPIIEELLDPTYNIEYGTQLLSGLIDRRGSLREALKAYGPMDMDYRYADNILAIYKNYR
jgi:soluble lytic murein transglycosylase-like protein